MNKKMSRRDLLKAALLVGGGSAAAIAKRLIGDAGITESVLGQSNDTTYLPMVRNVPPTPSRTPTRTPTPTNTVAVPTVGPTKTSPAPGSRPRVVYVHSNNATVNTSGYFWQQVKQATIDTMVDTGVMNLTGTGTVADAWRVMMTGYTSGQKVAIKVSFNNSTSCGYESNNIDAVVEPVLAVIRGLRAINVPESDIYVYECFRYIPTRFITPLINDYPDVKIYDGGFCSNLEAKASNQNFTFATPPNKPGITPHPIPQVLLNAHHLINIPIMKFHSMSGYSLGMKNHYGSTTKKPSALHEYSSMGNPNYTSTYSPIVDLNLNPNIRDKTRLILADGLFSAFRNGAQPAVWQSFGNKYPNSLMFAFDPVAIDCVMADYLDYEHDLNGKGVEDARKNDYLVYAEEKGLGILERGDPWTNSYTKILLNKIEV